MKETTKISLRNHAVSDQSKNETTGNKSASVTGYVAVCTRCKFINYEDNSVNCSQGHWFGDDDPENPPRNIDDDPWTDCEDFAT
jgi:hypothetical protein